uniref:Uncharacterized protein n=1 Tax=Rhodosorus marinus TaxID=101924 RepID=A0A7S3AA49_9RHOD|mmetsp:Transcript_5852/g.24595  ORF Transcript_5852/g.24595 Transcript_5852/m.24595 type:complete len:104 (+) Transcript_5852:2154-2465(+)
MLCLHNKNDPVALLRLYVASPLPREIVDSSSPLLHHPFEDGMESTPLPGPCGTQAALRSRRRWPIVESSGGRVKVCSLGVHGLKGSRGANISTLYIESVWPGL